MAAFPELVPWMIASWWDMFNSKDGSSGHGRCDGDDQAQGGAFEVTNRIVLALAAPMTLAYLTTPLLGLVDTAVVGQLNDVALLAGLAAGAVIFDLVFTSFNFLRAGTTGLVAQAYGADDIAEEQKIFWRASILRILCGIVLIIGAPLICLTGTGFIGASDAVGSAMTSYIGIRLIAAPFSLMNYVILGVLLGKAKARHALGLQVLINILNICLSVWWGLYLSRSRWRCVGRSGDGRDLSGGNVVFNA
jgi:Na+-driven multidrug efflux pump